MIGFQIPISLREITQLPKSGGCATKKRRSCLVLLRHKRSPIVFVIHPIFFNTRHVNGWGISFALPCAKLISKTFIHMSERMVSWYMGCRKPTKTVIAPITMSVIISCSYKENDHENLSDLMVQAPSKRGFASLEGLHPFASGCIVIHHQRSSNHSTSFIFPVSRLHSSLYHLTTEYPGITLYLTR